MNLKQWCKRIEKITAALNKEYFNLQAGLKYNKNKIKALEKQTEQLSEYFVKKFKQPKEMYNACIDAIAGAKTYDLSIRFREERNKKIRTNKHRIKNKPVTWDTWRQFATQATHKQRKEVYDKFIKLTPKISPIIKEKFEKNRRIYSRYRTNPAELYAKEHKLTIKHLIEIIKTLRNKAKKPFIKQFRHYSKKILNKKPEYYDDLYYVRNAIYNDMIDGFKGIDPITHVKKTMREMGLNPNKIKLDKTDRPKKYASPFCYPIKIPQDVRISFKPENRLNDANSVYHEFGHAIHFSSIKKQLPYWKKYIISDGLAETFSIFFECLLAEHDYLTNELKLKPAYAKELIRRIRFLYLFEIAFYTANSLFRIGYWKENLKFKACDTRYAEELRKSMGLKIPGAYWKLHHILPENMMYVPSYMLAKIQQNKITQKLRQKYGKKWWKNMQAGKEILTIMSAGADSTAGDFSKMRAKDAEEYVKEITKKI